MIPFFLTAIISYLLGSVPFGYLLVRIVRGQDIRQSGSGNIGATNVARSSPLLGAVTLLLDAAKGVASVWIGLIIGKNLTTGEGQALQWLMCEAALFAIVGHIFPVWLRFRGGKGVATAAGVLIALDWRMGLSVLGIWLLVAFATRYSSLAALVAAVASPVLAWHFFGPGPTFWAVVGMAVLLVVRHHANIAKLLRGEESRIGGRKAPPADQEKT